MRGANPAPVGNQRARTHGAFAAIATDRLEAKVAVVFEAIAADAPLRETDGGLPAADTIIVSMLAKTLCRLEDVEQYLALHGIVDGDGAIRPAVEVERRLRADVGDSLDALGMTPRARARLGLDLRAHGVGRRPVSSSTSRRCTAVRGEAPRSFSLAMPPRTGVPPLF